MPGAWADTERKAHRGVTAVMENLHFDDNGEIRLNAADLSTLISQATVAALFAGLASVLRDGLADDATVCAGQCEHPSCFVLDGLVYANAMIPELLREDFRNGLSPKFAAELEGIDGLGGHPDKSE